MQTNKVALVTGAGSGIGRASALALARAGYQVVLLGRRAEALEQTCAAAAAESAELGARLHPMPADVTDEGGGAPGVRADRVALRPARPAVQQRRHRRAAVHIDELSVEQWRSVVDINLNAVFICSREAFGLMRRQDPRGGRIINNGSISAHAPRPLSAPYSATKHAITGLTKAISLDGRAFDIACGQIDIGNAATEMTERMAAGILQANGQTMVEPRMDVRHVADAVVHMASLPLSANVQFMTIMATSMPFVGRG